MNPADRLRRCDRCGAVPKYEVILTNGNLLLCGHHCYQHKDILIERYPVLPIAG